MADLSIHSWAAGPGDDYRSPVHPYKSDPGLTRGDRKRARGLDDSPFVAGINIVVEWFSKIRWYHSSGSSLISSSRWRGCVLVIDASMALGARTPDEIKQGRK